GGSEGLEASRSGVGAGWAAWDLSSGRASRPILAPIPLVVQPWGRYSGCSSGAVRRRSRKPVQRGASAKFPRVTRGSNDGNRGHILRPRKGGGPQACKAVLRRHARLETADGRTPSRG